MILVISYDINNKTTRLWLVTMLTTKQHEVWTPRFLEINMEYRDTRFINELFTNSSPI